MMLLCSAIAGFSVSCTVTTCVAVALLPLLSVTVHVTVVAPNAKTEGALLVTLATAQLSAVTGVPKLIPAAEQPLFVPMVNAGGAVMVGLVESVIITTWLAVAVLPLASVTV